MGRRSRGFRRGTCRRRPSGVGRSNRAAMCVRCTRSRRSRCRCSRRRSSSCSPRCLCTTRRCPTPPRRSSRHSRCPGSRRPLLRADGHARTEASRRGRRPSVRGDTLRRWRCLPGPSSRPSPPHRRTDTPRRDSRTPNRGGIPTRRRRHQRLRRHSHPRNPHLRTDRRRRQSGARRLPRRSTRCWIWPSTRLKHTARARRRL